MPAITEASETSATQTPKHIKGLVLAMASIYCQKYIAWAPSLAYDAHACRRGAALRSAHRRPVASSHPSPTRKRGIVTLCSMAARGVVRDPPQVAGGVSLQAKPWLAGGRQVRNHHTSRKQNLQSRSALPRPICSRAACHLISSPLAYMFLHEAPHPGPQPCAGMFVIACRPVPPG
ncbi:hypothetical protein BGZ61DRAFT_461122 [Ilyonectria robusta]|uniref:uncharacterized protein n=1 Tax=Ilyonectria robusta TaxID=1079257 RepID=UPI001E8E1E57|nr:uncharacterized protein BGZ61DRAFT_461122 [Ilyonectria robusta]KAH8667757.1 hypothetical protein BGZ61DRAFT_461122 [Ilyonectria robusta]